MDKNTILIIIPEAFYEFIKMIKKKNVHVKITARNLPLPVIRKEKFFLPLLR